MRTTSVQSDLSAPDRAAELETLARVWASVLDRPTLGPDDDFFASGGNSVLAVRSVSAARAAGVAVSLRDVVKGRSARGALAVRGAPNPEPQPQASYGIQQLSELIERARPASRLQLGMIFQCEVSRDPALYHVLVGFTVLLPFELKEFERTIASLMRRQEVLRSSFELVSNAEPLQITWREVSAASVLVVETERPTKELRAELPQRLLSWRDPPLWRAYVSEPSPRSFDVTLSLHHAIVDGWSVNRLCMDLIDLYAERGDASAQSSVHHSTMDTFVAAERAATHDAATCRFWEEKLHDVAPLLDSVPRSVDASSWRTLAFDSHLPALRLYASRHAVGLKAVTQALHASALMEAFDRDELTIGAVTSCRSEVEGEECYGLFINTLPVTFELTNLSSMAQAAESAAVDAHPFRYAPLASLEHERSGQSFDTVFNYTEFGDASGQGEHHASSWWSTDKTHFPLSVECMVGSRDFGSSFGARYDPSVVSDPIIDRYLTALRARLTEVDG